MPNIIQLALFFPSLLDAGAYTNIKGYLSPNYTGGMKSKSFNNGRYNNGTHITLRSVKSLLLNIWSMYTLAYLYNKKNNLKSILDQLIY